MKLYKILLFFFAIYFIRRFLSLYQLAKRQQQQLDEMNLKQNSKGSDPDAFETDFKVIK